MTIRSQTPSPDRDRLRQLLLLNGITPTGPRLKLAQLLFGRDQHLTADQVIGALRTTGARISKATVYNTLNLFAAKGLLKALNLDPVRCSFDSNTAPHFHFHDVETGALTDVAPAEVEFTRLPAPPAGMESLGVEVVFRVRRKT